MRKSISIAAAGARPALPRIRRRRELGIGAALVLLVLLTRVPLLGRSLGEADCARYLLGLGQWLMAGAAAPGIYAKVLSPGYYALAAWVLRHSRLSALSLLDGVSLAAALASAPLLYLCGCRLTRPVVAAWAAAIFLLSPAFWWLGLEAHPQGPSFFFFLLALFCFLQSWRPRAGRARRHPALGWGVAAAVGLGVGLLLKNDLILQAGLFPALSWGRAPRRGLERVRRLELGAAPVVGAVALFVVGRRWLLGQGYGAIERATYRAVAEFWNWPHGIEALKQILPMLAGPGLATVGVVGLGLLLGLRQAEWRRRWGWPLLAGSAPGPIFWMLLRGNNARHMAPFLLLPLWAALEAWMEGRRPWPRLGPNRGVAALALTAIVGNFALIPPSSNTTLYPSADVPRSQHLLARRTFEMRVWLLRETTAAVPPHCLLGNYTLPYLQLLLISTQPNRLTGPYGAYPAGTSPPLRIMRSDSAVENGPGMFFLEVNSSAEYRRAAAACGRAASLEYDSAGRHRQFFGQEWRSLPWQRRWYPARPASIH